MAMRHPAKEPLTSWSAQLTQKATMMPPVMKIWLSVTSMPRRSAGASSELKNGVMAEEMPTATPETTRAA